MDYGRANLGPDFAHDGATFLMALSIRDSQVPVPNSTETCENGEVTTGKSVKEMGLTGQIFAAACLALVFAFVIIVARALW